MKRSFLFLSILAALTLTACKKDDVRYIEKIVEKEVFPDGPGTLALKFDAVYGEQDFELNKKFPYQLTNESGEYNLEYEFTKLRYWVSNVKLINEAGEEYLVPDSYYLVEEVNEQPVQDGSHDKIYPANKRETINITGIPIGDYKAVKFSIGVEPKYNDNLALRVGELNALNGMANEQWMWFTSYIFTSVAGNMTWVKDEPESKSIFWETGVNSNYKEITIDLGKSLKVSADYSAEINLKTDVKQIIDLETPWTDNVIGATKPELMSVLTDNYVLKAITLVSAESKAK